MYIAFPCLKNCITDQRGTCFRLPMTSFPQGHQEVKSPSPPPGNRGFLMKSTPAPNPAVLPFPPHLPGRPRRGAARLRAVPLGPRTAPGPRHRLTSGGGPRLRHLAALPGRGPARGDPPVPPQLVPLPLG